MCVILWVTKTRPTQDMVENAYDSNKDGGGGAWREMDGGAPVVVWKKGLNLEEMIELCATAPLPYIAHFRVASIGGIRPALTHPFLISKTTSPVLTGRTKDYVLFHNGHWKEWNGYCMEAAVKSNTPVPVGAWSDTRAMAWLCSIYGNGFMNFLPEQKGIIFGPNDMQIYDGNGWSKVNDVWCSNDFFMRSRPTVVVGAIGNGAGHNGRFCRYGSCTNTVLDEQGHCFQHPNGMPRLYTRPANVAPPVEVGAPGSTGGSRVPPSPFVQQPQAPPVVATVEEIISIETAEALHKEHRMSNNLLKKIRRHWEVMTTPGYTGKNAEASLKQISATLIRTQTPTQTVAQQKPSLGSVH